MDMILYADPGVSGSNHQRRVGFLPLMGFFIVGLLLLLHTWFFEASRSKLPQKKCKLTEFLSLKSIRISIYLIVIMFKQNLISYCTS